MSETLAILADTIWPTFPTRRAWGRNGRPCFPRVMIYARYSAAAPDATRLGACFQRDDGALVLAYLGVPVITCLEFRALLTRGRVSTINWLLVREMNPNLGHTLRGFAGGRAELCLLRCQSYPLHPTLISQIQARFTWNYLTYPVCPS